MGQYDLASATVPIAIGTGLALFLLRYKIMRKKGASEEGVSDHPPSGARRSRNAPFR